MVRYRIEYPALQSGTAQVLSFDAPDINTALLVADINVRRGPAVIFDGDKPLAMIERRGRGHRSFWYVEPAELARDPADQEDS